MNLESQLRTDLAARADDIADAPSDLVDSVVVGYRRQNRRRAAGALAAVACAALVAVGVPMTVTAIGGESHGSSQRAAGLAGYTPYPEAPRGSLAGDAGYLAGLIEREWSPLGDEYNPPTATRQVLFAGEVPGGVQALVSGWLDGRRMGLWLHGPAGTDPADLEPSGEAAPLSDVDPLHFTFTKNGQGALIVLARPGDVIEVSPASEPAADGSVIQAPFEAVGEADGSAVVDASTLNPRTGLVRVSRNGTPVFEGAVGGNSEGGGPGELDPTAAMAGALGDPDPVLVRQLVEGVVDELGLTVDDVVAHVLWGGPIGNANRPDTIAVALGVRLPSGAVVAVGGYRDVQRPNGGDELTAIVPCLRQVLPAGTELTTVAMRCDLVSLRDGASLGSQLVVVPPSGSARLVLRGGSGAELGSVTVDGPAYVGAAPDGLASVTAVGADGRELADIPLGTVQKLTD